MTCTNYTRYNKLTRTERAAVRRLTRRHDQGAAPALIDQALATVVAIAQTRQAEYGPTLRQALDDIGVTVGDQVSETSYAHAIWFDDDRYAVATASDCSRLLDAITGGGLPIPTRDAETITINGQDFDIADIEAVLCSYIIDASRESDDN